MSSSIASVEDDFSSDVISPAAFRDRLRPPANKAQITKTVDAGINAGLTEDMATALAYAAANQQQLRAALKAPKVQRFGADRFIYLELDVLMWRVAASPDNVRFEGDHARGDGTAPRFGCDPTGQPVLTLDADSAEQVNNPVSAQVQRMIGENPHVGSILNRGIETPGWLSFARITTPESTVTVLESTDGFGRTAAAYHGLGIGFRDVVWTMVPGGRMASTLHNQVHAAAHADDTVTDEMAAKVRCAVMPNARVIIGFKSDNERRTFDKARRRLVGHLHLSPPYPFTVETSLNAKANTAVDGLDEAGALPKVAGMAPEDVRDILSGTVRGRLKADQVAVLAAAALNPRTRTDRVRLVNQALMDLTGASRVNLTDRTKIAAEVALRGVDKDDLTRFRAALERAWQAAALRGPELSGREPLELLASAQAELDAKQPGAATAELAVMASFHLVISGVMARSGFGKETGNVEPLSVIRAMVGTRHGLHQLAQVVLDARAHRRIGLLPPGLAAEPNKVLESLTGDDLLNYAKPELPAQDVNASPADKLASGTKLLEAIAKNLESAVEMILGAEERGVPLVEVDGYSHPATLTRVTEALKHLSRWQTIRDVNANRRMRHQDES